MFHVHLQFNQNSPAKPTDKNEQQRKRERNKQQQRKIQKVQYWLDKTDLIID